MQRGGRLASQYGQRLLFEFSRVSIPGLKVAGAPAINCLILELDIEDGLATSKRIVLEGERLTVNGEGTLDFREDEIDVRLTPHVRNPGLVSVAATVDVTGSIRDPQFRAVARSIVTSAASALWRNAMRPGKAVISPFRKQEDESESHCTFDTNVAPPAVGSRGR